MGGGGSSGDIFCRDTVNLHQRFIEKAARKPFVGHSVEEGLDAKLNYLCRSSKNEE